MVIANPQLLLLTRFLTTEKDRESVLIIEVCNDTDSCTERKKIGAFALEEDRRSL